MKTTQSDLLILCGGSLLLAALWGGLGWLVGGEEESRRALVGMAICLPLAILSYFFSVFAFNRGPVWQLGAVLGGTGARLMVAGALVFWLRRAWVFFDVMTFGLWTASAYLATLSLELGLVLWAVRRGKELAGASGSSLVPAPQMEASHG